MPDADRNAIGEKQENAPKIVAIDHNDETRVMEVEFNDGIKGRYAYIWLRDMAPHPAAFKLTDRTKARLMLISKIDVNIKPDKMNHDQEHVCITWPDLDGDVRYTADWLYQRNVLNPVVKERRQKLLIDHKTRKHWSSAMYKSETSPVDWTRFSADLQYQLQALEQFNVYGIMHFVNMPKTTGPSETLTKLFGFNTSTFYDDAWPFFQVHFADKIGPNIAFTSKPIGLHNDQVYLKSPPEVQILHAIKQAGIGGENQFCDGFYVVEQLRKERPEVFKILTETDLEFIDDGKQPKGLEHFTVARRPMIELNRDGSLRNIYFHQHGRTWYTEQPPEKLPSIYEAIQVFNEYCYKPEHMFQLKLQPGEAVMFTNLRVMHARSSFTLEAGEHERLYEGTYFTLDVIESRTRVLRRKLGIDTQPSM